MRSGALNYLSFTSYRSHTMKSPSVGWDACGGEPSTPAPGLGGLWARHCAAGGTGALGGFIPASPKRYPICPLTPMAGFCAPRKTWSKWDLSSGASLPSVRQ